MKRHVIINTQNWLANIHGEYSLRATKILTQWPQDRSRTPFLLVNTIDVSLPTRCDDFDDKLCDGLHTKIAHHNKMITNVQMYPAYAKRLRVPLRTHVGVYVSYASENLFFCFSSNQYTDYNLDRNRIRKPCLVSYHRYTQREWKHHIN